MNTSTYVTTSIPVGYPEREGLVALCLEVLAELGPEWRISIHPSRTNPRWSCAVVRVLRSGARGETFTMGPDVRTPDALRPMLFAVLMYFGLRNDLFGSGGG